MVDLDTNDDGRITKEEIQEGIAKYGKAKVHDATIGSVEGWNKVTQRAKNWLNDSGVLSGTSGTIGEEVSDQLDDKLSGLKEWVKSFVWGIVRPIYKGFYYIPLVLATLTTILFLGGDKAVKETVEGFPGIADLPVLLATFIVEAAAPFGSAVLLTIDSINRTAILAVSHQTGLAAPLLLAVLQMAELGLLIYLAWSAVELASSVTGVSTVVALANVVTVPFRKAVEVIR